MTTSYSNPTVVDIVFRQGNPLRLTGRRGESINKAVGLSDLEAFVVIEIFGYICEIHQGRQKLPFFRIHIHMISINAFLKLEVIATVRSRDIGELPRRGRTVEVGFANWW